MATSTWGELGKGDRIELAGRVLEITKIKGDGKRRTVTVRDARGTFTSKVKAKSEVTLAPLHAKDEARRHDRQSRWAKASEAEATERREGLPAGDSSITKRPEKATGGPWDAPKGNAERILEDVLGATLVGEATDEDAGYYVPPVDESTVAAHTMLFHGEVTTLGQHADEHDLAKSDTLALRVNHWHTKERP